MNKIDCMNCIHYIDQCYFVDGKNVLNDCDLGIEPQEDWHECEKFNPKPISHENEDYCI